MVNFMNNPTYKKWLRFHFCFFTLIFIFASALSIKSATKNPIADFDGDGKTDISVFRPSDGYWYISKSSGGYSFIPWGLATDTPVPGDYDGDGKFDVTVCRGAGLGPGVIWYILRSSDSNFSAVRFDSGYFIDFRTPAPADYDGDGKTDVATFNLTDILTEPPTFYVNESTTGRRVSMRGSDRSDVQVPSDYDGDGKADYAFYRSGRWTIIQSSNGQTRIENFGLFSDKLVPADYDGDGKADIAVWRPSNGYWYWLSSRDKSFNSIQFGLADDKPVPGDYDGDGKIDVAVFRPSNGVWYLQQSSKGFRAEQFGLNGDVPIPNVSVR